MIKVALFGLGYTGKFILNELPTDLFEVIPFSKSTQINHSILANTETLEGVQLIKSYLINSGISIACITFPPERVHPHFWEILEELVPYRILFGTSSIYKPISGIIHESTDENTEHPRFLIERNFREKNGTIIRLSGIYGPGRNPLSWISRAKDLYAQKQLNLIHVSDIVQFLTGWFQVPEIGELYNLSDGQHHTWGEIVQQARLKGLKMPEILEKLEWNAVEERFISPEKVLKRYPNLNFCNFFESIEYQVFGD